MSLLMIVFLTTVGFFFVGPFIGFVFALPFYGFDLLEVMEMVTNPIGNPGSKPALYIVQGVTTFTSFIVIPILYAKYSLKVDTSKFWSEGFPSPGMALLTAVLVIVFMGFNSIFIDFNSSINLPDGLSGLENVFKQLHETYEDTARFLTNFEESYEIWAAFLVIAVIPAIGEELVFRGFIQTSLLNINRNPHLAIWLTALFFGLFHLDFYGLLPRTILGALFGYLFYWSGNIFYPIIAHFINNGFTLLMIFLYRKGAINIDIESTDSVSFINILVSFVLSIVLVYIFRSRFKLKTEDNI